LYTNTAVDITSYAFFHFAAQASRAGQDVTVILYDAANKPLSTVHLAHYGGDPVPGTWKVYNIALSDLRANATHIKGVAIQSHIYGHGTLHLDSISLTEVVSSQASAPTANVMPIATLTLTPIPTITGVFTTLPPGAQLPSEVECAERVHRSSWEPRPDNHAANHRVPTAQQIVGLVTWGPDNGQDAQADTPGRQITGNFTGTTDEILQWASCKWGIDVNIVRAQAISESHWYQNDRGDQTNDASLCPPGTWNGTSCYQSYGIFQIKYIYNKTAWPMSRDDTAFNAEHTYASIRACYEGWRTYLYDRTPIVGYPRYHPGDIWGCVGSWYSGSWYDQGALNYIKSVKKYMANKQWLQPGF